MKWFKRKQKKRPSNEYIGFFFDKEGISIETEDLLLFPKRETVFTSLSKIHKQVFFPLCSINMTLIEPDWDFYGHFVYVFREKEASLHASKYHTKHCSPNSLGFDMVEGKYDVQAKTEMLAVSAYYQKYQKKVKDKHQRFSKDYAENGLDNMLPKGENLNYLVKCFGKEPMWMQKNEWPKDLSGRAMLFVGQVRVMDFIGGSKWLYLFYSAEHHYFVQIEQR